MPELPEVETTRRGITPHLLNNTITRVVVRERRLRWPIPEVLETALRGQSIASVERRAKYLILNFRRGHVLLHLGMSGSLRVLPMTTPIRKHDHVDLELSNGYCLRFTDPRRFGALLWTTDPPAQHPLLQHLGPEPLSDAFSATRLYTLSRGRQAPVKTFIMDSKIVVGVGNIYANEALFHAGISPMRAAGRISLARYEILVTAIRQVLEAAIEQGGTTLRDFVGSDGNRGYFRQQLTVYDRAGLSCINCGATVRMCRLGQRSTYYCAHCQR